MTAEAAFTDEEWVRVRRAPMVAGMAISLADPGGPIELSKETMATLRGVGAPPTQDELLLVVSQQVMAMGQQRENPMKRLQGRRQEPGRRRGAAGAARDAGRRGGEGDARGGAAFARWMVEVAQDAADAAKEGGFMGFGAEQVSEGEQRMLDQLRTTLGVTA